MLASSRALIAEAVFPGTIQGPGDAQPILLMAYCSTTRCYSKAAHVVILDRTRTVRLAINHKVAIGAHPGLPDLVGFGRRAMQVTPQEVYDLVLYQLGALAAFARAEGAALSHLKPHGALYNMAAKDAELAQAIA